MGGMNKEGSPGGETQRGGRGGEEGGEAEGEEG